jgi:hypothetical protein
MSDYYELLKIPRNADEQTIKKAYRTLARQYHPDQNKSAFAAEQMKLLNAAYDMLSDPVKRREYDALLTTSARQGVTLDPFAATPTYAPAAASPVRSWFTIIGAIGLMFVAALTGSLLALRPYLPALLDRQLGRPTPTALPAAAPIAQPTLFPTFSPTPTATDTPLPTATPSRTPTPTLSPTPSRTPTPLPTSTPTPNLNIIPLPSVVPPSGILSPARKYVFTESPDGQGGLSDIFISDADGGNKANVTRTRNVSELSPSWSPGGLYVVYSEANSGSLVVMNTQGVQVTRLISDPLLYDLNPVWSPVGPVIAFRGVPRNLSEGRSAGLFVIDVNTQRRQLIADRPGIDLTFSPDGKWVAYRVLEGNGFTLHLASVVGGFYYHFWSTPALIRRIAWTQDAQHVVFEVFLRDTNRDGRIDEQDQPDVYIATLQPLEVKRLSGSVAVVSPRGRFPGPPSEGEYYPPVVSIAQQ